MKRVYSVLLSLALSLSLHANGVEIDGVYYLLDEENKTATVTFTGETGNNPSSYSGNITIPATITYNTVNYRIVAIGDSAFYKCTAISTAVLPDSATTIGKNAFQGCSQLASVQFPKCLKRISDHAFYQCTKLDNVVIPNTVTYIGHDGFYYCTNLKNIILPNSIITFGNYIFAQCSKLTSVNLPQNLQNLYVGSFASCTNLSNVRLPDSLTTLWQSAFSNCPLQSLYLPEKLTFINTNVFLCDNLSAVYCAATKPPTWKDETAFYFSGSSEKTQVDTLYVPWKSVDKYKANANWSAKFKVITGQTFGESEVEDITPTTALLKWEPDSAVSQYTIRIYTGDALYATYVVDSMGHMISQHRPKPGYYRMPMDTTVSTTEYYVISLEDLGQNTSYYYTIDGTDTENNLIYRNVGAFVTALATERITTNADLPRKRIRKIFRNGQMLIIIDNRIYTPSGLEYGNSDK